MLPETDGLRPVVITGAAEDEEDRSAETPDAGETEIPGVAVLPAPETERAVTISLDELPAEDTSSQEI